MAGYDFAKCCTAEQEWNIITTFLDKLEEYDQLHFQDLFNYLATDSSEEIQKLCSSLTVSQKHGFFKNRPSYFVVQDNYISKAMSSEALEICAHKKFCSSARYILQCFGSVHYLEIKKVVTFVFEDVAHYMLKLPPEEEQILMRNIRNVVIDDSGILTLTTTRKVGMKRISPEEKCLLAIVYYLGLHGLTHFKKMFEELESFAKKECDLVFGECSDSNQLEWLKKYEDYFQVHEDNFVSLYEEFSSYKCDYQKLKSEQLPLQVETTCSDFAACQLSQAVDILTSADQQNAQDNIVTSNRTICKKFYISATYLTSCFNPLHYLEVKECIFFLMEDVANVLRKLSLVRLQKIFEKVPFTSMDENGFLHFREDCNFDTSFVTNEDMLNLFVVYYLGFCGKTHFEKVIEELTKRAPEAVCNSITKLSAQDQLKYFKQLPQYFGVNKRGELDVNESFALPYFEYRNDTVSDSEPSSKEYAVSSDKCIVIKRISSGFAFLLNFFQLKLTLRPFRVILHVLDDTKAYFLNLSALDQIDLVKDVFTPFTVDERDNISFSGSQFEIRHLTEKEMEFLYFACLISDSNRLHYREAFGKYIEDTGKIPKHANSDSLRFRYFKKADHIFEIGNHGYITLCPLPRLDLVPSFFPQVVKSMHNKYSTNQNLNFSSSIDNQVISSFKESSCASQNNSCKIIVSYATDPKYKTLCGAVSFLLTYFNSLHHKTLKDIISHVLTDVGIFLSKLPLEEQDSIFKSIPRTSMDKNGFVHLTSFSELHTFVSRNKKQFLFITCFLAVYGETHYTQLLGELQNRQLVVGKLTSAQFYGFFGKYPKYFTRNSSGYLRLSHSFTLPHVNFVPTSTNQSTQVKTASPHQKFNNAVSSVNARVNSVCATNSSSKNFQNQSCNFEDVEIRDHGVLKSDIEIQNEQPKPKFPLYRKIQDGILHLLQYFILDVKNKFLQVLLLVLDDYETFHYSSTNDKIDILKRSFSIFRLNEEALILSYNTFHSSCLTEREKEELLVSFIVYEQGELHFLKVFNELNKYNLASHENKLDTSAKFRYFKERKDIFYIGNDGYVSLLNWPPINLAPSTVLDCFSSADDTNLLESETNCQTDLKRKNHIDLSSNISSSTDQFENACESEREKEKYEILGVDEIGTSAAISKFGKCDNLYSNVDKCLTENDKFEEQSNDQSTSLLNSSLIILDSSPVSDCLFSSNDMNHVESESNYPTNLAKKMHYIDQCTDLLSNINQSEPVYENTSKKEEAKILGVDETTLSTMSIQLEKHSTLCLNATEAENGDEILSGDERVEDESNKFVEAACKFNANHFSPSREWFTFKNDQSEETANSSEGDDFKKEQLENTATSVDAFKAVNNVQITEKDEQVEYTECEKAATVTKFNPNMFIPSKEWFSSKNELANAEDSGTKPKIVKKPLSRGKCVAPSSSSPEIKMSSENGEKFKCVESNAFEKDLFIANLPVPTKTFSSADTLTKQTCVDKKCDKLNILYSSSQTDVAKTLTALIQSIRSLLKYYDTKVNWLLVCGVFQVMNDVTNKFILLSKNDQSYVLERIFRYFSSDKELNDLERVYSNEYILTEEQEILLVITYILSREKKMDYLQLFKKIEALKKDLRICGLSDSDKYQYLVKRNKIFSIEAGFVKLQPFPHLKLKSQVLEADLGVWKDINSRQVSNEQPCVENKKHMSENNLQLSSSQKHLKPSKLNHIAEDKPTFSKSLYPPSNRLTIELHTAKARSWPKNAPKIYGEFYSCIVFLKKSSDIKIDWRIVCAVFQVMNEVRSQYLLLSKDIQTKFLEYVFLESKMEKNKLDDFYLDCYPLNEEQQNLLLLASIIAREKKVHYLRLFEKFRNIKDLPGDMQTDSYKYISRREHLFSIEDGYVKLLPFPILELKRRVLDVDLRIWKLKNYLSGEEKLINNETETLENKLQTCNTTVKLDLSHLGRIADKLTGPKILNNANQTLGSNTNPENKPQTSFSTTQLTTSKFNIAKEKVDNSTSTNEEISNIKFQAPSSLTKLDSPVLDISENHIKKTVLEDKSQILGPVTENKISLTDVDVQLFVNSNVTISDVSLNCLEEKTKRSLLIKDFYSNNDFRMCNSIVESKVTNLNSVAKDVGEAETLNDPKLDSENILQTSNSAVNCDLSKSIDSKELSEISSTKRKKKVLINKTHPMIAINDSKIHLFEEKSCELSNEDSKITIMEGKPFQDSSPSKDSVGMKKRVDESSSVKNKEKVSKNQSQSCGVKTKLKTKKVNKEKEKIESPINKNKVALADDFQSGTSVTKLKSTSLNITEKQSAQSPSPNGVEVVSESRSSCHETKALKSLCSEEKGPVLEVTKNIVSGQSKVTQKNSVKIKGLSKDSSPVSKECLDKLRKRMQAGIVHLLKYFRLTTENLLLKVLFHVLGSSKLFAGLPNDAQMDFLRNCFHIFHLDKKGGIVLSPLNNETKTLKLKHEEKILLSVTCVLSQCKELHYRKIFQQLQNQMSIPGDKEQFNFFRKRTNLFSIASNGYVKLCNFPDIEINPAIFSTLFQAKTAENASSSQEVSKQNNINSVSKSTTHKKELNSSGNDLLDSKVPSTTGVKIHSIKPEESLITNNLNSSKSKIFYDMCKKVKDAIYFLLNYFKFISEPHLICVILHALKDVRSYFGNLDISGQDTFVNESLGSFSTDSTGQISKVFYLSLQFNLSNNDKDMLFLCFILGQVDELHYQEIFNMYSQYQRVKPASVASPLDLHKYLSEIKDLFSLTSDGYVKLNLHFVVGQNSKILPTSSISLNSRIACSPILNSNAFKNIQITQQTKNCEVQQTDVDNQQLQKDYLKHERFEESVAFLNSQFDGIASDCAEVIILHILNDLRDLDHSIRKSLLSISGVDSSKSRLGEEEKDLLVIAYVLIKSGPLHYCKLFELLQKQSRDSLKVLTELELYEYILKKYKHFSVTRDGIVSLNAIFNPDIENFNHFNPTSEEYFKISLSKTISTENDSCCDQLIDSLIKDNGTNKNKNKPKRASRKPSRKPTFNLLEIITEESSSDSISLDSANSKAFSLTKFPDAPKTRLEQQSVYFFAALLSDVKTANSLKEHLYLASGDIQSHLKDCYDDTIDHFLEIHQMHAP